jgi:hypothetical protein
LIRETGKNHSTLNVDALKRENRETAAPAGACTSDAAPGPAAAAASHNGNGFERKLGVLETDIKDLKLMMTGQLQEMENKSQKFREDQFRQLINLLKQERQQKEELLRQVTRLEMENKTLKRVGMALKQRLTGKPAPGSQK